ncbi:MAG: zinc dependent phospholipase C family protein [Alkaliphilus sp.]
MFELIYSVAQPLTDDSNVETNRNYRIANIISTTKSIMQAENPTHSLCISQAITILQNDGFTKAATIFAHFLGQLDAGVVWADRGFESIQHYYDTVTEHGKWHLTSAAKLCEKYTDEAASCWKNRKHSQAMIFLGAAAHLVQDMCVPHHACCVALQGHHYYEKWAQRNRNEFKVEHEGIYKDFKFAVEWIRFNALFSRDFFPLVNSGSSENDLVTATNVLLPRAQRTTSGFLLHFYNTVMR